MCIRDSHIEGENIPSGVGITVYCPLPEGYWIGQLDSDWAEIAAILLVFLVPFIIFLLRLFSRRSRGEQACGVLGVMLLFGTVTGTFALASLYTHDENLFYGILIILIILFFAQFVLVMRESKRYAMQKGPALVTLALGLMLGTAGCVSGGIVLFAASGSLWLGLGFPAMIFSSMLVNARMFKSCLLYTSRCV